MFLQVNCSCYAGHQSEFSKNILPMFYVKVNFFVWLRLTEGWANDFLILWQPEKSNYVFSGGSFLLSKPAIFTKKAWRKAFAISLWVIN